MSNDQNGGIMAAMLWMFIVSLLLFWLPFIGPLIAGIVGGKKAGGVVAALLAVFLPGVLLGVALFFLASFGQWNTRHRRSRGFWGRDFRLGKRWASFAWGYHWRRNRLGYGVFK